MVGLAHNFAVPLGLVMAGGRKSSVVLTLRWRQRDSSSPTAMAGRSWRGGGVTGGTQEWTAVCWGPWVMEAPADPMSVGGRV